MPRPLCLACVTVVSLTVAVAASQNQPGQPTIRLRFPERVDLTGLSIWYFMTGPFGGYGSFVRTDPAVREYALDTLRGGRQAEALKAIVYCPGYRFVVLTESALGSRRLDTKSIELEPLDAIPLSGEIILARPVTGLTIEAGYFADWECEFFNHIDCLQAPIIVATSKVAEDGSFALRIPDFVRDPVVASYNGRSRGRLRLIVRETTTGNIAYAVEEVRSRGRWAEFPVASEYPQDVQLVVVPRP